MTEDSIYAQIGGEGAIVAAVAIFYEKVLNDPILKHYFVDVDMLGLVIHQQNFLRAALGGNIPYSGRGLYLAHQHLKITESHFGQVAYHLEQTLLELKVPKEIIDKIMVIAGSVKDDIVAKQQSASKSEQKQSSDKVKKCPFAKKDKTAENNEGKFSGFSPLLYTICGAMTPFIALLTYLVYKL